MKYNFDEYINRRNTGSLKWDTLKENELPMWVADMDFKVATPIIEGFNKRINQGIFGYTILTDEFFNSYINWWKTRHHFEIKKEWLIFSTGVVPTISSSVRRVTKEGDYVVVLTPVYNIFFNSILNNKRIPLTSNLVYKKEERRYEIDYVDLENKLKDPKTTLLIFCNPHNPVGKIWYKEDLIKVGELCAKYNVLVLSDEIHCDLTDPGKEYIPFASVNETNLNNSITCIAPTKAFNLAGIQTSALFIPNEKIRKIVDRGLNTDEVAEPNILAAIAPVLAFNYSSDWLDEVREYIYQNKLIVKKFLEENIKEIKLIESEATYLLWLDVSSLTHDSKKFEEFIREKTGLHLSEGEEYGEPGKDFLRMNIATRKDNVIDGLNRLKKAVEIYKNLAKV